MVLLLRLHSWEKRKIRMGGGLWGLEASYQGRRIRNCWSGRNEGGSTWKNAEGRGSGLWWGSRLH